MLKQGQSKRTTPHKERGFNEAIRRSLTISRGTNGSLLGYLYWHLDLNCGSGHNTKGKCDGSPIVFLKEAKIHGRIFCAAFCDNDFRAIDRLESRVERHNLIPTKPSEVFYYSCDNSECLEDMTEYIVEKEPRPQYAMGSLFLDPNAPGRKYYSLSRIVEFSNRFPRIDLIINWNYSQAKRCRGQIINVNQKLSSCKTYIKSINTQILDGQTYLMPRELMKCFNKKHWLVMESVGGMGHQFVMLIGRRIKADESGALIDVRSNLGNKILDQIENKSKSGEGIYDY